MDRNKQTLELIGNAVITNQHLQYVLGNTTLFHEVRKLVYEKAKEDFDSLGINAVG